MPTTYVTYLSTETAIRDAYRRWTRLLRQDGSTKVTGNFLRKTQVAFIANGEEAGLIVGMECAQRRSCVLLTVHRARVVKTADALSQYS